MSDIMALLAALMSKKDLINLARTSRGCFGSAIEFVWREVRGVHNLFRLIPGTKCSAGAHSDTWKFSIPDLSTADLSRFNFYAPLVSHLHILPSLQANYRFSDWEKLMRYTKSTTLLPNLQTLVYARDGSKGEKFIRWILPFLSAKLLTVRTHSVEWSCNANISARCAAILLKAISKRCVDITDLSFFPVDPFFNPDEDETGLEIDSDSDSTDNSGGNATGPNDEFGSPSPGSAPFYKYLKQTRSLQNLTTTSFIIHSETLEVLASLPKLKKITLDCAYRNKYIGYQLSPKYPENPFPSLEALRLFLPDMECVSHVWRVGPLVNRLTDVSISLRPGTEDGGVDDDSDDEFAYTCNSIAFIPELCKRSPHIQKLTVDFDALDGAMIQLVLTETLKSLVTLPLQTLDLRHALLANVPQACQVLGQCHTLRDLYLQDQRISYDALIYFAQIPKLECLHIDMHWADTPGLRRCMDTVTQRVTRRPSNILTSLKCSHTIFIRSDLKLVEDIAGFLCVFFPKLERVSFVGTSTYRTGQDSIDSTYVVLGYAIKKLRERLETRQTNRRSEG